MVMLDGREVLDAVGRFCIVYTYFYTLLLGDLFHKRLLVLCPTGVPNKRQSHDLALSSAYSSYSVGGEPHFTASVPSEKNKTGTECLDYVFYTTGECTMPGAKVFCFPS